MTQSTCNGTAQAVRFVAPHYRAACAAPLPARQPLIRKGLTLLEVILALTILALSMVAIGELIRMGTHSARDAQDLTQAQLLCESKLSEIVAGVEPYDVVERAPLLLDPDYYYTVQLEPTEEEGVLALAVTVETRIERKNPVAFTLVRWVPDPLIELPQTIDTPDGNATDDGTTGSGTTNSGTDTGGSDEDENPTGFGN